MYLGRGLKIVRFSHFLSFYRKENTHKFEVTCLILSPHWERAKTGTQVSGSASKSFPPHPSLLLSRKSSVAFITWSYIWTHTYSRIIQSHMHRSKGFWIWMRVIYFKWLFPTHLEEFSVMEEDFVLVWKFLAKNLMYGTPAEKVSDNLYGLASSKLD